MTGSSSSTSIWTWSADRMARWPCSTRTSGPSTRQRFGYPADLVERIEAAAADLLAAVTAGREPFGRASGPWLDLVR